MLIKDDTFGDSDSKVGRGRFYFRRDYRVSEKYKHLTCTYSFHPSVEQTWLSLENFLHLFKQWLVPSDRDPRRGRYKGYHTKDHTKIYNGSEINNYCLKDFSQTEKYKVIVIGC